MKIQVLIRSAEWLNRAGTRIRYVRLKRELSSLGWHLAIDPIARINEGLRLNSDIYLFSKCHDAGARMLADMLREAGAVVGFDLFDDYISGHECTNFGHRTFQRSLTGKVDFLLCSTGRMAQIARSFDPQVPIHVLNDPYDFVSPTALVPTLRSRLLEARADRKVDIVWFGQGNNPVFPVGLSDAVAFGTELAVLCKAGWKPRLKILSNPDALDQAILGPLQNLPMRISVEEWTEAGEAAALDQALIAFLPVNFQNFSIAKSLNRAVSALARGAQVFNPGFPLYDALGSFVYRSASELADDLEAGQLKLNEGSVEALASCFATIADPTREAGELVRFFTELEKRPFTPAADRVTRGIIHGSASPPAIHRLCTSLGWLSLGSPFSRSHQPFHAEIAQFEPGGDLELRVSRDGFDRMANPWRERARALGRSADGYSHLVPLPNSSAGHTLAAATPVLWSTRAARILNFPALMRATGEVYGEIFPQTRLFYSELEMPLYVADPVGMPSQ